MNQSQLPAPFDDADACCRWLASIGSTDAAGAYANIVSIIETTPEDLVPGLLVQVSRDLPNQSDCDRAINNLERLISTHAGVGIFDELLDPSLGVSSLLILLSDSQFVSDLFIKDFDDLKWLKRRSHLLLTREQLVEELAGEMVAAKSGSHAKSIIRKFKQRHIARIACGDLVAARLLPQITGQISILAEAICECGLGWVRESLTMQWGEPRSKSGTPVRLVVLALGKLGGTELNYSSDIDLIMVYEEDGLTASRFPKPNRLFFEQLTRDFVRLLSEATEDGPVYRVDLRLRPYGSRGAICSSRDSLLSYYDFRGRTWERQALINAKPVAGDLVLGRLILDQLHTWIYRKNLSRADIVGIKALKRRIERRAIVRGEELTNVKTGRGGIRDIEFVIQFLQLLNGGVLQDIHDPNTLNAIKSLEVAGCLTSAESTLLSQNYCWLRKLEHRLQLMFDLQTHTLPAKDEALRKTAMRMGYVGSDGLEQFRLKLRETTQADRTILDHLLHGAFGMTYGSLRDSGGHLAFAEDQEVPAEVDLVLEPEPDREMIHDVMEPFGFRDVGKAFECLMELASETTPFLSPRRCHHFLASISPAILREIATTPDPDATLVSLSAVSDSLGAKGVLWELFSFNPPTLNVYVRMCATSDYLTGILKRNPGMIDELIDALQVVHLPDFNFLFDSLSDLVNGAEDIEPIVHSFKNAQHLGVGVRDILGRDNIQTTHRALADVAEVCLQTVTRHEYVKMLRDYTNTRADWQELEPKCPLVIIGLGKLGGREPNYHSDLDLIFLYQPDRRFEAGLPAGVSSQHFFSQLAANISSFISHSARFGTLFEMDCRLRPTGKSGSLAISTDEFERYFQVGPGRLWERQALCKARPVFGSSELRSAVSSLIQNIICETQWNPQMAVEMSQMRSALEQDCSKRNLKRGAGGTVDVEFSIQALQLKHASGDRSILLPGTLESICKLVSHGYLEENTGQILSTNYQLLRSVEARLRLINTTARHDLPDEDLMLEKLAFLLKYDSSSELRGSIGQARRMIRDTYDQLFGKLVNSAG